MRFYPCPHPGCPELAEQCAAHRKVPWHGRNGSTRQAALGVSSRTWDRLRRAALRRDVERCLRCGAPADAVDHLVPTAWRAPPRSFTAHLAVLGCLCHPCHDLKTQREATLGAVHGSPPPSPMIADHTRWWSAQIGGHHAAV